MKKSFVKAIAVFMVVIMAVVCMPVIDNSSIFSIESSALTSNNNSLGNNVKWSYDTSSKVLTISGSGDMPNFSSTPSAFSSYNWKLVVTIANHATKIVVNSGVTSIGNYAFKDFAKVTSVTLPASVKSIGQSAFEGCSSLTSVTMNEGLTSIGANAFKNTKFASVSAPTTLTSIGSYAFANVSGLKFTCVYGSYAHSYCKQNSVSYTLKSNVLVCEPVLDTAAKQITVTLKYVYNPAKVNAANFSLTYNNGAVPVSTDMIYTSENDVSKAVVFNGTDKVSVAVMASDYVPYNTSGESAIDIGTIVFNINENADTADFNLKADVLLVNGSKTSVNAASASVGLHNYVESVTTAPTCSAKGVKTITCTICGKSTTEEIAIDANNHSGKTEIKNATASTCTVKGYSGDTVCSDCGATVSSGTELALADHNYESKVVEPDCKNGGYTVYTCKDCGHSYTGDETAAGGHKYDTEVVAPDCTNSGYTIYTCSVCGVSYRGDNVASLGHDYDENGKCTRCGDILITEPTFNVADTFTVDNEAKTVIAVINNVKVSDFLAMVDGEGWTLTDAQGNTLEDSKKAATSCVLKHSSGTAEYTLIVLGDVNFDGSVNALDARIALRASARLETLDDMQNLAADVNYDSKVNALDARVILRVAAKLQSF